MALRYLLDENLSGLLWRAIQHHNQGGGLPIDAVQVGDAADLPLGSADAAILLWAEREDRILVTFDRDTMAGHLARHLQSGHHSPGVIILRPQMPVAVMVGHLEVAAHAGNPDDFRDRIAFLP